MALSCDKFELGGVRRDGRNRGERLAEAHVSLRAQTGHHCPAGGRRAVRQVLRARLVLAPGGPYNFWVYKTVRI
eukprot:COSAG02_NODE_3846_length_6153_cov_1.953089_2_plen_74_part_00